ncbi:hypothetical protein FE257_007018 [Aspergillus nanangensis]|uniref:Zn(2)-C6 fungal-type domain-containing protein n=1 Tax=Aspergillus nanangensis TaxID=2582783 RepID=A0AAD4CQ65_ASPNN|nr:hypothetical protein FE257_007018 [Aspergillus nanangensis]
MSSGTRPAPVAGNRSKRRMVEPDDDGRSNPPLMDDSAANPKRQRVSRACDSCRSKKDKCDGVRPICSTCASLSRPCTYKANPKKRGLPTGYIRSIELLWGLVFCKIQGSEEVVRALMRTANMPSHLATMGKEAEGSDTLLSSWKNSNLLKDLERMLLFLEQPEDEQNRVIENDSPPDGEASSVLSADALEWHMPESLADSPAKTTPSAASIPRLPPPLTRPMRDSETQTPNDPSIQQFSSSVSLPLSNPTSTAIAVKLPSNAWPLLDIYFSYTQCWFPILEKHDILRTAFRLSENDTPVDVSLAGSGDYAALWSILTLASIQEASISATRQLSQSCGDKSNLNQLYTTAQRLIPGEDGPYELGHVQALLILSLVKIGQQDWPAAWMLVGRAIRIYQCLGLNSTLASNDMQPSGRSKHVFLGCFVLETLVALRTGQVPCLRKEDLSRVGPINEDGLEEWHPWEDQTGLRPVEPSRGSFHRGPLHALSTFNRLVSLMCIQNDLCCVRQNATDFSQLESLQRQLQLWVSSLPKSYRIDLQSNPLKPASPHIFGLEMMYQGAGAALSQEFAAGKDCSLSVSHKMHVTESLKRLLMLLQQYMETYSLSATCPTFGLILTLGISGDKTVELEPGLKQKLQSFSSHLSTVWSVQSAPIEPCADQRPASVSTAPRQPALFVESPTASSMPSSAPRSTPRRISGLENPPRPSPSASNPYISNPWMRAPNMDDTPVLSLPTPTPSVNINRGVEASQMKDHSPHRPRPSISSTKPMNAPMIPEFASPYPPTGPQYQTPYSDPSLSLGSFVDIDGYGSLQRPRIAPDLDALFDELASLDGTEKIDNQPEFMQNLGFVPDAGMPELYAYGGQVEPYFLPTQPLPSDAHEQPP